MKKIKLFNNVKTSFNKLGMKTKKNSPEILIGVGLIGFGATAVLAFKAGTKYNEIKKERDEQLQEMKEFVESNGFTDEYSEKDYNKDVAIVKGQCVLSVAKSLLPTVAVGTLSVASLLYSHKILRGRNAAIAAAYLAVDKGFKAYRENVVERFGEETDKELRHGVKEKEHIVKTVNSETGEVSEKNELTKYVTDEVGEISEYARFFDESCNGYKKDSEYNLKFLKMQQAYANEKLKAQGYLFLNDVYKMLGIPATKAGQVVGWIYDKEMPNGDNFVDFGIYNIHREKNRDFVNGYERSILLDFNVDGVIIDYI